MAKRIVRAWLVSALVLLSAPAGVLALPPLPYSPYGTVQINDAWVPDGTMVRAFCDDVEYGSGTTVYTAGTSRYSITVLGDDPETGPVEGCSPGETVVFTVDGLTADQTATWTAGDSEQINLTALRPEPAILLEKHTNNQDADVAPGPQILVRDTITWTYTLTNTGNVPLMAVSVTDDQEGIIPCPQTTLAVDEVITCTQTAVAQTGQYSNLATASGDYESTTVEDTDPSHYFGQNPVIDIEKATNGVDADAAPGVFIPVGLPVTWTFSVTNTGNVNLSGIVVMDDILGSIPCPKTSLTVDEGMACEVSSTVVSGQHADTATATGTPPLGTDVSDSDSSHYYGVEPGINMDKLTDGIDADLAPGPYARVGQTVNWSYVVTNTGNITLTSVTVTDDQGVTVDCPGSSLASSDSLICTASAPVVEGVYTNLGTVNSTPLAGNVVSATDRSHYFGIAPSINLEKSTNGVNADTGTGPLIRIGDPVTWTYRITNTGNITLTNVSVVDSIEGIISCPVNILALDQNMICELYSTASEGQYTNTGTATGTPPVGADVSDVDTSHYYGAAPAITLQKYTNGQDAPATPGPYIVAGDTVSWTYVLTNIGNVDLTNIVLLDDREGDITTSCPSSDLAAGAGMTCTWTGLAAPGQYTNVASVTAVPPVGSPVTDIDTSHYFGITPALVVEKWTNGEDADTSPGPYIRVGDYVTWTVFITNTGNITLTTVTLLDDQSVDINCPKSALVADEGMQCEATGIAVAGQYRNEVLVSSIPPAGPAVTDTDISHYFGVDPSIDIEKMTNGLNADIGTGPIILVGDTVTWTYWVTNTGNSLLSAVQVSDNQLGVVGCPLTSLSSDQSMVCQVTGSAVKGQYSNNATVTGTPLAGTDVADSDSSHYYGGEPGIVVNKATNGLDADNPPGLFILVGDVVTWTYVLTNTGNIELDDVELVDDQEVTVSCPASTLPAGEVMTCQATAIAAIGQYVNNVTATGAGVVGIPVASVAVSHYFGATPGITITKYTKGLDITSPPGPILPATTAVTWTYAITNTGNVTLTAVNVIDDQSVIVTCPQNTLVQDEGMLCSAEDAAIPGQYTNVGTASGQPPAPLASIHAADYSHYFGYNPNPSIQLKKLVNRRDANTAPGVFVEVGQTVTWTYEIANTGNITVNSIVLTDDMGTPAYTLDDIVVCTVPELGLVKTEKCTLSGSSVSGQYVNIASASGIPDVGDLVTDTDASYYFGITPSIVLDKRTNGMDAGAAPGPLIMTGDQVTWTYVITNTGNVTLTGISLLDDVLGAVSCPKTVLSLDESMNCSAYGVAFAGQYTNTALVTGTPPVGDIVTASDTSHYFGAAPVIHLQKFTNGLDADTGVGPFILEGSPVTWTYAITNTGNVALSGVTLSDDVLGSLGCPKNDLTPDESMVCSAFGTASLGQYTNIGTVDGIPPIGSTVSDTDISHYFGAKPSIDLEKSTNGLDADTVPGPILLVGDAVTWTYTITNTGNVTLTGVTLSDDILGSVSCPQTLLEPDESMECILYGFASVGQRSNIGTVTGTPPVGEDVSDTDSSHYFGSTPDIYLEKATNGVDGDTIPGVFITVGDAVTWTYVVTNTSNVTLTGVSLVDDMLGSVICPEIVLVPGESMPCMKTGTASTGQYTNTGTVSGTPPTGGAISDNDTSHYFGVTAGITLSLATNGLNASVPPGLLILVGETVSWTYTVTNTGNSILNDIVLSDDQGVSVTCPEISLVAGESMTCTASAPALEGQYRNEAFVSGHPPAGPDITASAVNFYFGVQPSLSIEKSTNNQDADAAPGPLVLVGDPITWTYIITNTGNGLLENIDLSDDELGTLTCPLTSLEPLTGMTCQSTGIAQNGQYANLGIVSGTLLDGSSVDASDPSHYFGAAPSLDVQKTVSTDGGVTWLDSDSPPGPYLLPAVTPVYSITLSNTGNVILTGVKLSDSDLTLAGCAVPQQLTPGQLYTCSEQGTWQSGQFSSSVMASVQYTDDAGALVDLISVDFVYFFGVLPGLDIEKAISSDGAHWFDADEETSVLLTKASSVLWWHIVVTNTGNVSLDLALSDVFEGQPLDLSSLCNPPPPHLIDGGTSYTCAYTNLASSVSGLYMNTASAEGSFNSEIVSTDNDMAFYAISQSYIYLPIIIRSKNE